MRKQLLVTTAVVLLLAGAGIAAWAALRARQRPEWTTRSPAALAELRRGLDAERKFYEAESRRHFAKALELDPRFAAAQLMLLRWSPPESPKRKALLAGLAAVDRARLTPREAFLIEYQLELGRERAAQARLLLDRYLAAHPRDPYALDIKINVLWEDQRWPQAETTCEQLLALDPNWVTAQNKLGYLSMSQGRFAEAEDRFRTYLYVAPDQANPRDSLGELFVLLGRWDDARRELEASLAVRPDFCVSYFHLSQMALIRQDVAGGRAELERARRQPACEGFGLEVRTCGQQMWELFERREWAELARQFDQPCLQKTRAFAWLPHLGAVMSGDFARARQVEAAVAKWNAPAGRSGHAAVDHLQGVRLVAEGKAKEAAARFAAADAVVTYFGIDSGYLKLYNRLQWANALAASGDAAGAARLLGEVAAVNRHVAELYRSGRMVLPHPPPGRPRRRDRKRRYTACSRRSDRRATSREEERATMRRHHVVYSLGGLTFGTALGAGLMFLLDPASGRRRRDAIAGALSRLREQGTGSVSAVAEDAGRRSRDLAAAVRARLRIHREDPRTLESRVRARLGRVATNPGAIAVIADGTRVTLRGSVPPDELDDVLDEVAAVQGVREVYNLLQVQLAAPYVPGHN